MAKVRTTLTIDEQVLRAVKVHAVDLLERLWAKSDLGEEEALALAVEAQHKTRRRKR